jgi:DHA1 family bicyclomycin/chloramphenicol resistance-like MFS transporter
LGQIVFGLLAMTICLPSMQEWGAIFQADNTRVQLTFSAFVIAYGGSQLLFGPLSDRYGRRAVLLVGLALGAVGSAAGALVSDIDTLIAARTLQGLGSGATMVIGRSLTQDFYSGAERTRVMAFIGMALGLCPPTATVIGGQLHVWLGWQANLVLMAVLAVALFVMAWRLLPPHKRAGQQDAWLAGMIRAYASLTRVPIFLLFVALLASTTGAFYTFLSAAPLVLRGYGVGPDGVGFYVMLVPFSYITGNWLTSRLIRRVGDRGLMLTGQAFTCASMILILSLSGVPSPLAFAMPVMLMGLGHGLMMPPTLSGSVGTVPAIAGAAAAVAGVLQQLTGALGGYLVGYISHQGSLQVAVLMTAFTGAGLMSHWRLNRLQRAAGTDH